MEFSRFNTDSPPLCCAPRHRSCVPAEKGPVTSHLLLPSLASPAGRAGFTVGQSWHLTGSPPRAVSAALCQGPEAEGPKLGGGWLRALSPPAMWNLGQSALHAPCKPWENQLSAVPSAGGHGGPPTLVLCKSQQVRGLSRRADTRMQAQLTTTLRKVHPSSNRGQPASA